MNKKSTPSMSLSDTDSCFGVIAGSRIYAASEEPGRISLLGKLADPCGILQLGGLGFKHLKCNSDFSPSRFANRETKDAEADFGAS
ncbi:hypothetical protein MCOR27_003412 [Pyricularia oryzae]|nr:hypothetical protein MCOR02_007401 [Pyricularia oryzae]KAI6283059.1 hypothetical protein MCOR27_003412 [Pyricularia oryzae]KAI6328052.1 hypothetical protein MCOR29_002780 [Pyricularia oryzae]KAI6366064.1 hypothetical protein MCOR31_006719 [Pyricularia oryzae]KAI6422826.1 hypothetical protein MCOR21_008509 [Pyricularia oryzae]